jgi:hypothetical protein
MAWAEQFVAMKDVLNETARSTTVPSRAFDAEKLAPIAPAGVRRSADRLSTIECPDGYWGTVCVSPPFSLPQGRYGVTAKLRSASGSGNPNVRLKIARSPSLELVWEGTRGTDDWSSPAPFFVLCDLEAAVLEIAVEGAALEVHGVDIGAADPILWNDRQGEARAVTQIYSLAFHTSYQYSLAYCFPEITWTFDGWWSDNRPRLPNVRVSRTGDLDAYDLYLAHNPLQYSQLACELEARGIPRERIIYISHWALQEDLWYHTYDGVDLEVFLKDVSQSAIVCVSHFMTNQFGFYSNVCVQAIPHYIPPHLFDVQAWRPGNKDYISVVNNFYLPYRGVGSKFWDSIDFVPKKLYGDKNRPTDAGPLKTIGDYKNAVSAAAAYLWTADAVAISFAPLEAMLMGCPVIAPRNLDWPLFYEDRVNIILYEEGNYQSCKEAVQYFRSSEDIQLDLSRRGRDAVLEMNNAELFRERWARVLDAALASARRGDGRLRKDAAAPLSKFSLLRQSDDGNGYRLVTSFEIAGKDYAISHQTRRGSTYGNSCGSTKLFVLVLQSNMILSEKSARLRRRSFSSVTTLAYIRCT